MRMLFLDFETYYDREYSLRRMTPVEYILDPRYESIGCAFKWAGQDSHWVDGADLPQFFSKVNWGETWAISHNALFDMLILSLRYGVFPAMYGDTLAMARNWCLHETGSVSLDAVSQRYGLPPKMKTVEKMVGVNLAALKQNFALYSEEVAYAIDDVEKCATIFYAMVEAGFPTSEFEVINWVTRMAAQPQLQVDRFIVAEHLHEVIAGKQKLLAEANLTSRDSIMSDPTLAAALMMLGVDPVPTKISKTTGKETYAFAKTDWAFTNLLEHENPKVQAIVAARLGVKSTLEETRSQRFLAIGTLTQDFPVPLNYSGAHTHRLSGAWKLNLQNLANESKLRKALKAPKGHKVVSVDASQIEARLNAVLSGEQWLIEAFRQGRDVYAEFAGMIYGRYISKQLDPTERFVGKTGILSLGYGSSWPVFQAMCRNKGGVTLYNAVAMQVVDTYRARCQKVVEHWKVADKTIIPMIANGTSYQWGALTVAKNKLILPNGNRLNYTNLRHDFIEKQGRHGWVYDRAGRSGDITQTLYGAKVVENECQSLAFLHIAEVAIDVAKMTEELLWPAHQVHDELIYVVPEEFAEDAGEIVRERMAQAPAWLPDAPLDAEVHIGDSYGDT